MICGHLWHVVRDVQQTPYSCSCHECSWVGHERRDDLCDCTWLITQLRRLFSRCSSLKPYMGVEGGGTNPCDAGLDLSGSWQQGHSATYNAPSRI